VRFVAGASMMVVVHCLSVQDVVGLWSERDALMMKMMMVVMKWS